MEQEGLIPHHPQQYDAQSAYRVFEEFHAAYHPAMTSVANHLEQIITNVAPEFAEAYRPWHKGLQELLRGVYLTARKIPLPDPQEFIEALRMFSFESAARFLCDLASSCRLKLEHQWVEHFREHIDRLLFSFSLIHREQELSHNR